MATKSVAVRKSGKRKTTGKARSATARQETSQVTSEEALAFIRNMQKRFPKTPRTRTEKAALQEYLGQFTDTLLKAVGSRVQSDLMLRPPRTIEPEGVTSQKTAYASRKKR